VVYISGFQQPILRKLINLLFNIYCVDLESSKLRLNVIFLFLKQLEYVLPSLEHQINL